MSLNVSFHFINGFSRRSSPLSHSRSNEKKKHFPLLNRLNENGPAGVIRDGKLTVEYGVLGSNGARLRPGWLEGDPDCGGSTEGVWRR
jgi:hypothetical protein